MNEIFLQLAIYHLLLNAFQVSTHADWIIGYSLIGVISTTIGVNLLLICITTLKSAFERMKLQK